MIGKDETRFFKRFSNSENSAYSIYNITMKIKHCEQKIPLRFKKLYTAVHLLEIALYRDKPQPS